MGRALACDRPQRVARLDDVDRLRWRAVRSARRAGARRSWTTATRGARPTAEDDARRRAATSAQSSAPVHGVGRPGHVPHDTQVRSDVHLPRVRSGMSDGSHGGIFLRGCDTQMGEAVESTIDARCPATLTNECSGLASLKQNACSPSRTISNRCLPPLECLVRFSQTYVRSARALGRRDAGDFDDRPDTDRPAAPDPRDDRPVDARAGLSAVGPRDRPGRRAHVAVDGALPPQHAVEAGLPAPRPDQAARHRGALRPQLRRSARAPAGPPRPARGRRRRRHRRAGPGERRGDPSAPR